MILQFISSNIICYILSIFIRKLTGKHVEVEFITLENTCFLRSTDAFYPMYV